MKRTPDPGTCSHGQRTGAEGGENKKQWTFKVDVVKVDTQTVIVKSNAMQCNAVLRITFTGNLLMPGGRISK